MFEMVIASLMILTGFCIGIANKKIELKGELPEIATTLFLLMGWFQASVYAAKGSELLVGFSLSGGYLSAFIGLSSLLFTGLSLYGIKIVGSKK